MRRSRVNLPCIFPYSFPHFSLSSSFSCYIQCVQHSLYISDCKSRRLCSPALQSLPTPYVPHVACFHPFLSSVQEETAGVRIDKRCVLLRDAFKNPNHTLSQYKILNNNLCCCFPNFVQPLNTS